MVSGQIFEQFCKMLSLEGEEVSLEQLLEARENRALLQSQCLKQYQQTVLSLTLLAVGGVKKNPLLDYVFAKSLTELTACFAKLNIKPQAEFIRPLVTGHEAIFVLPISATRLKQAMIELEQQSALARLWDLDVIDASGHLLSRGELGLPPRTCLICDDEAKVCARSRKHSVADLYAEMQGRVVADFIAEQVYQALLVEARLSPKPGLVDSFNNGAHQDMSLATFELSAKALRPFFARFVASGMATSELDDLQILPKIRPLGLQAESAMKQATQGVNTHKGAIFAFGLACTAIGRLYQKGEMPTLEAVCQQVARFCKGLTAELQNVPQNRPLTAGEKFYKQYGFTGARGEAEQGFPLVQKVLPMLATEQDLTTQLLHALLYLMANNVDTNVLQRGGLEGLNWLQQKARDLLSNEELKADKNALLQALNEFDAECIKRRLSAGGCADLLALSYFFFLLFKR